MKSQVHCSKKKTRTAKNTIMSKSDRQRKTLSNLILAVFVLTVCFIPNLSLQTVQAAATAYECENQSYYSPTSDVTEIKANGSASGGEHIRLLADVTGDKIRFDNIAINTSGEYEIRLQSLTWTNFGKYTCSIETGSGWYYFTSEIDMYATTSKTIVVNFGTVYLQAGNRSITFECSGKNGSSTSYVGSFDKITITAVSTPTPTPTPTVTPTITPSPTPAPDDRIYTAVTGQVAPTINEPSGMLVNGTYYKLVQVKDENNDAFIAFDVYRSTDGINYTLDRRVLDRNDDPILADSRLISTKWIQSPTTGTWTIWAKRHNINTTAKEIATMSCSTVNGDYTFLRSEKPFGYSSGDLGAMIDGNTAYIVSADTDSHDVHLFTLTSDCTTISSSQTLFVGEHREAPSIFKRNGYYYIFTSGTSGWNPNQQKYSYANSISGPWSALKKIGDSTGYHSQLFSTKEIAGSQMTSRFFSSTRNAQMWDATDSRAVWLPLYFNSETDISTNYYDYTTLNYATGEVKGYHYDHGTKLDIVGDTNGSGVSGDKSYDGKETSSWSNDNTLSSATITYDLGSTKLVKAVKLMLKDVVSASRVHFLKIEVGDGINWTTVFDDVSAMIGWMQPLDVVDTSGRYVRISNTKANSDGNNAFGIIECQIWGGNANTTALVDENFNTTSTGSNPSSWIVSEPANTDIAVQEVPSASNKSVKIYDNTTTGEAYISKSFTTQMGYNITSEFRVKFSTVGNDANISLLNGSDVAIKLLNSSTLNALAYTDLSGAQNKICDISADTWYTVKLDINTDTDTFDVYVNNVLVRGGASFISSVTGVNSIRLGFTNESTGTAYFDTVVINGPIAN